MLLLNGRNLTGLPLSERKALLAEHVSPIPHRLELTACEHVSRASVGGNAGGISARLTERLNAAMEAGKEGLMLKRLDQTYTPNSRGWLKIKPDFDEVARERPRTQRRPPPPATLSPAVARPGPSPSPLALA